MSVQQQTMVAAKACPMCGVAGQQPGQHCQGCGRMIVRTWVEPRPTRVHRPWPHLPSMTRMRWIVTSVVLLLCGIFFWKTYQVIPDPITLLFRSPSTDLASEVGPDSWAYRGGNSQGTRYVVESPRLPKGRVLWAKDVGTGDIPTQPTVADGVVYVSGYFKMMALKADTGEVLWSLRAPGPVYSSLTVAGDLLYVGLSDTRLVAIDRHTGKEAWSYKTEGNNVASALVSKGFVFIGSGDSNMYALDATNGKLLWKYETSDKVSSAPVLLDGVLYFAADDKTLYSVNYRTGQSKMRYRASDIKSGEAPVVGNGRVYLASSGGILTVEAGIREIPAWYSTWKVWRYFWSFGVMSGIPLPEPPAQQGTGWRFTPQDRGIAASPALTPEAFYVGTTGGLFYARNAIDQSPIWQIRVDSGVQGSPVVVGPVVYFGTAKGTLYALNRADGALLWQLPLGSPITAGVSFASGHLFVRTDNGWLHVVE